MRKTLAFLAVTAFGLSLAGVSAAAPSLDAKGKCRDGGKFVAASMCKSAAPAAEAASSMTAGAHPKKCVKGKACGNTCISVKDTCHK